MDPHVARAFWHLKGKCMQCDYKEVAALKGGEGRYQQNKAAESWSIPNTALSKH